MALVARVLGFLTEPRVINPDETFQYFEQAHRLVFGSGLLPWEFVAGIRSWLLPGAIAGVMELARVVSDSPLAYLDLTRFLASALSLAVVYVGFRLGERRHGLWAGVLTGGFCAIWFDAVWFAPTVMTEVLAAHIALIGFWLAEGRGRSRLIAAGACSGLALCLRFQYAPVLLVIAVWQNRLAWPRWGWLAPGGLPVVVLASGLLDWLTQGAPFQTIWWNFYLNTTQGVASAIGTDPPTYYLNYLLVTLWPILLLAIPLVVGAVAEPALGVAALLTVLMHTAIAHKEARFIYLAIAIAPILIGLGTSRLLEPRIRRRAWPAAAALLVGTAVSAWSAVAGPLAPRWQFERATVQSFLAAHDTPALCGLGVRDLQMFYTGGYTYFDRDLPLYLENYVAVLHIPPSPVPLPVTMIFHGHELAQYPGHSFAEHTRYFNGLIASPDNALPGYERSSCHDGTETLCLFMRPGGCAEP